MDIDIKVHDIAMLCLESGKFKSDSPQDYATNYLNAASIIEKILQEKDRKDKNESNEKMIARMESKNK